MRCITTQTFANEFIRHNQIPLGWHYPSGELIFKLQSYLSDSMLLTSKPGVGKSVLGALIIAFKSLFKIPVVIFDLDGLDHCLHYYPNSRPENLPHGIEPFGMRQNYIYFNISDKKHYYETLFHGYIGEYRDSELTAGGFSGGAAKELLRLIETYCEPYSIRDWVALQNLVRIFPSNDREAERHKFVEILHNGKRMKITLEEGDWILPVTKNSISVNLSNIIKDKLLFTLEPDKDVNFKAFLTKGISMVFSYDGNYALGRMDIVRRLRELIPWKKGHPDNVAPYIFIEDVDKVAPMNPTEKEKGIVEIVSDMILRSRKLGFGSLYSTPAISRLHPKVYEDLNEYIFGKVRGQANLTKIAGLIDPECAEKVRRLYHNRYENVRRFFYINEFDNRYEFEPFNAPIEIHRELPKKSA